MILEWGAVLGLVKGIPGFASWAEPRYQRWQASRVAHELTVLKIWNDGP